MAGITEEEAKNKWCLQSMSNCGDGAASVVTCCGSECMAWRFIIGREKKGYCGIAGNPIV